MLPSTPLSQLKTSPDPFVEDGENTPMKSLLHGKLSEIMGGQKEGQKLEFSTAASGDNLDSDVVPPSLDYEHELELPWSMSPPLRVDSKQQDPSSPSIPEESRRPPPVPQSPIYPDSPPDTQSCVLYDELYDLLPAFRDFCDRQNNREDKELDPEAADSTQLEREKNTGPGLGSQSNSPQPLEGQSTGNTVVDLVEDAFNSLDSDSPQAGEALALSEPNLFSQPVSLPSSSPLVPAFMSKPILMRSRRYGGPLDCLMCDRHERVHRQAAALAEEIHLLERIRIRLEARRWHLLKRAHTAGGNSGEDEL
ncbi:hypothetical protein H0H92_006593 [Tricholoma furcatifolium]|nr:hypothetical protein H0H92_006593 [Tricholoma furcatifolium]